MTALRPLPAGHCEFHGPHDGVPREDRPRAAYLAHFMPCHTVTSCEGRLLCVGHACCTGCAARVRADQFEWGSPIGKGDDVEVVLMHNVVTA